MNTMKMFDLSRKVAIVTGGYGLYGKNISTALCEAEADVVIAARNKEKCRELAENLRSKGYKAELYMG